MFSVYSWTVIDCYKIVWFRSGESSTRGAQRQQNPCSQIFDVRQSRRLCRPEDELTGRQSSVRYSGAAPTMQCRTRRAILNWMRFPIGSQWSSLRMAAETLSNLGTPRISLAAEFRTDWSRSRRYPICDVLIAKLALWSFYEVTPCSLLFVDVIYLCSYSRLLSKFIIEKHILIKINHILLSLYYLNIHALMNELNS